MSRAGHSIGRLGALGIFGDGLQEVLALEGVEPHARVCSYGRGAGDIAQEVDIDEEAAPVERGFGVTV